jgi:hypothetical protein
MVGDEVMDVMAALPPTNTETAEKVCNEYSNNGIKHNVVRYGQVSRIVSDKHYLLPKKSQKTSRDNKMAICEKKDEEAED